MLYNFNPAPLRRRKASLRMKYYYMSKVIEASRVTIWEILTNAANYGGWDSGVDRVEGSIELGSAIKVFSQVSPDRPFSFRITQMVPGRKMTWMRSATPGLFKGVRTFVLSPLKNGATKFTMREEFKGLLLPIAWRAMPDLRPSFEQFATGLKNRAERQG